MPDRTKAEDLVAGIQDVAGIEEALLAIVTRARDLKIQVATMAVRSDNQIFLAANADGSNMTSMLSVAGSRVVAEAPEPIRGAVAQKMVMGFAQVVVAAAGGQIGVVVVEPEKGPEPKFKGYVQPGGRA